MLTNSPDLRGSTFGENDGLTKWRPFQYDPHCMAVWFDFLQVEADIAMTLIRTARLHSNPANSARAAEIASEALAKIQRSLKKPSRHGLSAEEVSVLEKRSEEIKSALADLESK